MKNVQSRLQHQGNRRRIRALAVATCISSLVGLSLRFSSPGYAADPTGLVTSFAPEAGAVLGSELIAWQGEILVNKTTAGFTAFIPATGSGAASPLVTTNAVKTSTLFNGLLAWIDGTANIVRTANPGGTVTALAGAIPPTSDDLLGVGSQLWIARAGGVDRYSPTAAALGGATPLAGTFAATSSLRLAAGPDGNIWVVEKNTTGVDTLTRWAPGGVQVGVSLNFSVSSADPSDIVAGPDGGVWVVLSGTNSIARFDTNLNLAETPLPGGAVPVAIAAGPDGGVWITENALNNVSRLGFASGAITRVAYSAPSAFGLKGIIAGPDGNMWVVGTVANRVARFGTVIPPTTTTAVPTTIALTIAPTVAPTAPPTAPPTVAPTAPPTAAPTVPPATAAPTPVVIPTKVCVKTAKRRVKVGKKFVTKTYCAKYKILK
jgi:hypothetical protein